MASRDQANIVFILRSLSREHFKEKKQVDGWIHGLLGKISASQNAGTSSRSQKVEENSGDSSSEDSSDTENRQFNVYFPIPEGLFPMKTQGIHRDNRPRNDAIVEFQDQKVGDNFRDFLKCTGGTLDDMPTQIFSEIVCELDTGLVAILRHHFNVKDIYDNLHTGAGVCVRVGDDSITINGNQWQMDIARHMLQQYNDDAAQKTKIDTQKTRTDKSQHDGTSMSQSPRKSQQVIVHETPMEVKSTTSKSRKTKKLPETEHASDVTTRQVYKEELMPEQGQSDDERKSKAPNDGQTAAGLGTHHDEEYVKSDASLKENNKITEGPTSLMLDSLGVRNNTQRSRSRSEGSESSKAVIDSILDQFGHKCKIRESRDDQHTLSSKNKTTKRKGPEEVSQPLKHPKIPETAEANTSGNDSSTEDIDSDQNADNEQDQTVLLGSNSDNIVGDRNNEDRLERDPPDEEHDVLKENKEVNSIRAGTESASVASNSKGTAVSTTNQDIIDGQTETTTPEDYDIDHSKDGNSDDIQKMDPTVGGASRHTVGGMVQLDEMSLQDETEHKSGKIISYEDDELKSFEVVPNPGEVEVDSQQDENQEPIRHDKDTAGESQDDTQEYEDNYAGTGARPKQTSDTSDDNYVTGIPFDRLYWKYIEEHEPAFMKLLDEILKKHHVHITFNEDLLMLKGGARSNLAPVKKFIMDYRQGFMLNLKDADLPIEISQSINIHELKKNFPSVTFGEKIPTKVCVIGQQDDVDECLEKLNDSSWWKQSKITISEETMISDKAREPLRKNYKDAKPKSFDGKLPTLDENTLRHLKIEKIVLKFLLKCRKVELDEIAGYCEMNLTPSPDQDSYYILFQYINQEGQVVFSDEHLTRFTEFIQEIYPRLWMDTFDVDPKNMQKIKSKISESLPCLVQQLTESSITVVCESEHSDTVIRIIRERNDTLDQYKTTPMTTHSRQPEMERPKTVHKQFISQSHQEHVPAGFLIHKTIEVFIHKCDITKLNVDAVVNAANGDLHHGGGVAKAILTAAGPDLDKEGRSLVYRKGTIPVSQVAMTTAGRMPCKKVIHAIGPWWPKKGDKHQQDYCLQLLYKTFENILCLADREGFTSLAMPAVSSGIYGVPKDEVAKNICEAIMKLHRNQTVSEIHLVDVGNDMLNWMTEVFHQRIVTGRSDYSDVILLGAQTVASAIQMRTCTVPKGFLVNDTVEVLIHPCDITKLNVDVIVCSAEADLSCKSGLARVIADKAGRSFREMCKEYTKKIQVKQADIIPMSAHNLPVIYHAVTPHVKSTWRNIWSGHDEGTYKELLNMTFHNAFREAQKSKVGNIAISPIGAGQTGVPHEWVAEQLCLALLDELRIGGSIHTIHIVDLKTDVLNLIVGEVLKQKHSTHKLTCIDQDKMKKIIGDSFVGSSASRQQGGSGAYRAESSSTSFAGSSQNQGIQPPSYASVVGSRTSFGIQDRVAMGGFTASGISSVSGASTSTGFAMNDRDTVAMGGFTASGVSNVSGASASTGFAMNDNGRKSRDTYNDPNFVHSSDYRKVARQTHNKESGTDTRGKQIDAKASDNDNKDTCPICLSLPTDPKVLECKHTFCTDCIDQCFKVQGPKCPICGQIFGALTGNQPVGSKMEVRHVKRQSLSGYEGCGHIVITYSIPGGTQGTEHPHPGQRYTGTHRTAYLPDNREGNHVLKLLQRAFDARLTFTIGKSSTTGHENTAIWNDIHHKTTMVGGQQNYGYPDPTYLNRVQLELAAKGIK